jgi:hypothetical protein
MPTTKEVAKRVPKKAAKKRPRRRAPVGPLADSYILRMPFLDPPVTTNVARSSRGHWAQQNADKHDVQDGVYTLALYRKIPYIAHCRITVVWRRTDDPRIDNDALCPFLKACKDGLVLAGVLPDDRCQNVISDTMEVHPNCDREGLYLTIEPVVPGTVTGARVALDGHDALHSQRRGQARP